MCYVNNVIFVPSVGTRLVILPPALEMCFNSVNIIFDSSLFINFFALLKLQVKCIFKPPLTNFIISTTTIFLKLFLIKDIKVHF